MISLNLIVFVACLLVGLLGAMFIYTPIANKYTQTFEIKPYMLPFSYILVFYICGTLAIYYLLPNNDFIQKLTATRALVPLVLAAVIFVSSMLFSRITLALITFACVAFTVWLQPFGEGFPYPQIPVWAAKILLTLFFAVFCIFYGVMNSLPQIMAVPTIIILFAVSVLSAFSAAPAYLALSAALLIGPLLGYLSVNLNIIRIPFDNGSCCALAYLVANILLLDVSEFSFGSCLIFTNVFWAELLVAMWNKFIIIKSGPLYEHTFYYQAAEKFNMRVLLINISRISAIGMFIGWFQLYAINQYSLILVSLAVLLWLNYNFLNPTETKNIKQINKQMLADIKENIFDVKNSLSNIGKPQSQKTTKKTGTRKKTSSSKKTNTRKKRQAD